MRRSSKVNIRRISIELGISRNTKVWGRRRIHSTTFTCGKGSSFNSASSHQLSGFYEDAQLDILINNAKNNKLCTNLSYLMSKPDFLIACWVKIRSNKGSLTPALNKKSTLDGIDKKWFLNISNCIMNGSFEFQPYRRTYIPKSNGKLRPLTIPNPRDKIVQEAMKFLLEMVFEPHFRGANHGYRPGKVCHTALNDIRLKCNGANWLIKGDIDQQFPSMDHHVLVDLLGQKIQDQPFMDMIWKYLRARFAEDKGVISQMKIGVIQGGILSPMLSNIYMHEFDVWMEDVCIPANTRGKGRRVNPEYHKLQRSGHVMAKTNIRRSIGNNLMFKRMQYVRYVDDFLVGVIGSKADCNQIRKDMSEFLKDQLKLTLNVDKTKITNAIKSSALFLGYKIHLTEFKRLPIIKDYRNKAIRGNTRPLMDGPLARIVERLVANKYAKKMVLRQQTVDLSIIVYLI